jgi:hypothetical protein
MAESRAKILESLQQASQFLRQLNGMASTQSVAAVIQLFEREHGKLEMKEEMIDTMLDNTDESDVNLEINKVLEQVSLEIGMQMPKPSTTVKQKQDEDMEVALLEKRFEALK